MKKNVLIAAIATLTLTACVAPPKYDFVKDGVTEHQKVDALSECQYQIKLNKTPIFEQKELLNLCMQGKGYRYKRIR
jgi:hypothetical protein